MKVSKLSMVTAVVLSVVTVALGIGQAEAEHGGGRPKAPAAPHPKAAAPKAHVPHPKVKAQAKAKVGAAKTAQKKKAQTEPTKKKHDEKKEVAHKKEEKKARKEETKKKAVEHAKKATKKSPAPGADHDSIALLHAVHRKLHEADHDYGSHRRQATEHVSSALHHLGSSAQTSGGAGTGRSNSPQSVSDAIMREASASLETIKNRLAPMDSHAKGHGEAHRAVDAAIQEVR
jgi:outer membrane biosynthesis protein TonB